MTSEISFEMDGKVNFVIACTQKGGIFALDQYLRDHPDIQRTKVKEVHYFDDGEKYCGSPDYSQYHESFANISDERIIGEATPIAA